MSARRRSFRRPPAKRPYRKLFIIATEGTKTEPSYFALFNEGERVIRVECFKHRRDNSPPQVLKGMQDRLAKVDLRRSDEAWLVVDKDQWTDEQLDELHRWSQTEGHYGLAVSNPKFEYWLLLHFEDGTGIAGPRDCCHRLEQRFPDYGKSIGRRKITAEMINDAVRRAKSRDNPPCTDWPRGMGRTTVYKLVERILQS